MTTTCPRCRASFEEATSLGRWQCRVHPLGITAASTYACCGSAQSGEGCVRCDHGTHDLAAVHVMVVASSPPPSPFVPGAIVAARRAVTLEQVQPQSQSQPPLDWTVRLPVAVPPDAPPVLYSLNADVAAALRAAYRLRDTQERWARDVMQEPLDVIYMRLRTSRRLAAQLQRLGGGGGGGGDDDSMDDTLALAQYWESAAGRLRQPALDVLVIRRTAPAREASTLYRIQRQHVGIY